MTCHRNPVNLFLQRWTLYDRAWEAGLLFTEYDLSSEPCLPIPAEAAPMHVLSDAEGSPYGIGAQGEFAYSKVTDA